MTGGSGASFGSYPVTGLGAYSVSYFCRVVLTGTAPVAFVILYFLFPFFEVVFVTLADFGATVLGGITTFGSKVGLGAMSLLEAYLLVF